LSDVFSHLILVSNQFAYLYAGPAACLKNHYGKGHFLDKEQDAGHIDSSLKSGSIKIGNPLVHGPVGDSVISSKDLYLFIAAN
jgi:hypothetical protein